MGFHYAGMVSEPHRDVPFDELFGLAPGKRVIVRGTSLQIVTPQNQPGVEVVFVHSEDNNDANNRGFSVNFASTGVADFYNKQSAKRCNFLN